MTNYAYYHLFTSIFTPFSSINKTLTLQYTLKITQTISCSKNIVAVFASGDAFWFGPYTCGISLMNIGVMKNGVAYEITKTINPGYILNTAVAYKLVVRPDGSYSVHIQNTVVASGSVAADFACPNGLYLFQFSNISGVAFVFKQDQAGSVFDDILLTTS